MTANAALLALLNPKPLANQGVYVGLAEEGEVPPYVVLDLLSSPDRNVIGSDARLFTRPLYLVRAYTSGSSYAPAEAIAKQIDVSLLGARGDVPAQNVSVMGCFREEPVRLFEVINGVRFNYVGGRYRMFVSAIN